LAPALFSYLSTNIGPTQVKHLSGAPF
jgi:hypothetical protein